MFQPSKQHRNEDEIGHRLTLGLYHLIYEPDPEAAAVKPPTWVSSCEFEGATTEEVNSR